MPLWRLKKTFNKCFGRLSHLMRNDTFFFEATSENLYSAVIYFIVESQPILTTSSFSLSSLRDLFCFRFLLFQSHILQSFFHLIAISEKEYLFPRYVNISSFTKKIWFDETSLVMKPACSLPNNLWQFSSWKKSVMGRYNLMCGCF